MKNKILLNIFFLLPFLLTVFSSYAQEKEKDVDFCWNLYFFWFDREGNMRPECKSQFEELTEFMKEFPDSMFVVSCHTDCRGSEDYNMQLSERRASYHRDIILKQGGFNPKRIAAIGYGEYSPVIANAKEEYEYEQNRKTEIRFLNEKEFPLVFFVFDRIVIYDAKNDSVDTETKVDVNPQFPGGTKAFSDLIKKNGYVFPKESLDSVKLISIDCVVDENGNFSVVDIRKGLWKSLENNESKRNYMKYLENMPLWIPAKCQGKTVPVRFSVCLQL